jgi:hypothetical protein
LRNGKLVYLKDGDRRYEGKCPKCGKSIVWGDEARDESRLEVVAQEISEKELKEAELWRIFGVARQIAIPILFFGLTFTVFKLSIASLCYMAIGFSILPMTLFCMFQFQGNFPTILAVLLYGVTFTTAAYYLFGAADLRSTIFQYLI